MIKKLVILFTFGFTIILFYYLLSLYIIVASLRIILDTRSIKNGTNKNRVPNLTEIYALYFLYVSSLSTISGLSILNNEDRSRYYQ